MTKAEILHDISIFRNRFAGSGSHLYGALTELIVKLRADIDAEQPAPQFDLTAEGTPEPVDPLKDLSDAIVDLRNDRDKHQRFIETLSSSFGSRCDQLQANQNALCNQLNALVSRIKAVDEENRLDSRFLEMLERLKATDDRVGMLEKYNKMNAQPWKLALAEVESLERRVKNAIQALKGELDDAKGDD